MDTMEIKEENVDSHDADGAPTNNSSPGGGVRVRADLGSLPDPSQFLAEEPEIPDPSTTTGSSGAFGGISSSTTVTRVPKGSSAAAKKRRMAPQNAVAEETMLEEGQIVAPEMSMSVGGTEIEFQDDDPIAATRKINAMPTEVCPICGDKANGVHYGIYTCEAYVILRSYFLIARCDLSI